MTPEDSEEEFYSHRAAFVSVVAVGSTRSYVGSAATAVSSPSITNVAK